MRRHSVTVSLPWYSHLDVYRGQREGLVSVLGPGVEALPVRQACNRQHNTWCLVIKTQACNRQQNTWCLVIKRQSAHRHHEKYTCCLQTRAYNISVYLLFLCVYNIFSQTLKYDI